MIEFADFSGTRVLIHNSFPNKNIRACNVELHDDWNKWFKYDTSLHIQKNLENIRKIDFARETLEFVENYGLKFRTERDRHVKYLYMKVHGKEIRPSRIWNLIMPYSEQTRIRPEAANYATDRPVPDRITYYLISRCRCLRVWSCVFFAIAQQYNFVVIRCIGHNISSLEFIALEIHLRGSRL